MESDLNQLDTPTIELDPRWPDSQQAASAGLTRRHTEVHLTQPDVDAAGLCGCDKVMEGHVAAVDNLEKWLLIIIFIAEIHGRARNKKRQQTQTVL